MTREPTHTFHLCAGDTVVSRFLLDGPGGRKGDPVRYYSWEVDAAAMALAKQRLQVVARCVMGGGK